MLIDQLAGSAPTITGWQSQGGSFGVVHSGTDQWTVRLGGLTGVGGNVQLTQYLDTGEGPRGYCAIESWGPDATAMVVKVRCWNDNWSPATQVAFGVLFDNSKVFPTTSFYEAFWQGTSNWVGQTTPPTTWLMNHTPRLTRTSQGHYTVEYLGAYINPFPLVTAWGTTPRVCNVVDWFNAASTISPHELGRYVRVACFDFAGVPLDSGFSFQMSNRSPLGVSATTGGRLLTGSATGVWTKPATDNVNTVSGVEQASNAFLNTATAGLPVTQIDVPGYPGAFGALTGADTLESVGDDGARCYLENPPVRNNGSAHLWVQCTDPKGVWLAHRVHAGTWGV